MNTMFGKAATAGSGGDAKFIPVAVGDTGKLLVTPDAVSPPAIPNFGNGQVTAGTSAGAMVAARATRKRLRIKNTDAAISVYIGAATVTAVNGFQLKAGEAENFDTPAALQVIAASGSPVVTYFETWD